METKEPLRLPAFEKVIGFAVQKALEDWRDEALEGMLCALLLSSLCAAWFPSNANPAKVGDCEMPLVMQSCTYLAMLLEFFDEILYFEHLASSDRPLVCLTSMASSS